MTHHQLTQLLANPCTSRARTAGQTPFKLNSNTPNLTCALILLALHKAETSASPLNCNNEPPTFPTFQRLYLMLKHPPHFYKKRKSVESASDIISFLEEYPDEDNTLDLLLQPTTPATKTPKGATEEKK